MDLRLGQLNRLEEGWLTKRFYEQENPIFTSSSKRKEGIRKKKKKEEVEQESLFLSAMLRKRETCSRVSSNFPFSFLPTSLPPSSLDSPMEEGRRRTVKTAVSVEATPPTQRVSFPMKQTAGHYFSSMSTISLRLRPTRNYVIAGKNAPTRFERTRDFKCGSGSYKNRVMTGVPSPESS
ncbi:hypothetical protein HZH66_011128 [Vespula vulgaris]|uniref:Uncharacterized protein n=1 Tax=Vespula vulgaris TaxID=7454 RepID=A0A834JDW2_VESVU|nr:hypothetical protein HZH66_011128 [Vespula vulgaris]